MGDRRGKSPLGGQLKGALSNSREPKGGELNALDIKTGKNRLEKTYPREHRDGKIR